MAVANNPVDAFVYSNNKSDDPTLRAQVLDIVSTYTCMGQYSDMVNFFSNPSNIEGIKDAKSTYGLPPKNTPAYHTTFGGWHDFCDWQNGMYKFYLAAKLFVAYPNLEKSPNNCEAIADLKLSLQQEKTNAERKFALDGDENYISYQTSVIDERMTYYNGLYNGLTCDVVIQQKLSAQAAAENAANLAASQASNLAVFQQTTASSANTSKLATYVAIGVAVLIGGLVVIKVIKK